MHKHTIIGMAGHIDHGKTALIKALTGIETDTLKEEKARGITIDIGFAYWKNDVTIIDVPGHERFVKNMVAGVSTVDLFLLVIAADDGIMPQTTEHLEILKVFGIRNGLAVINKMDLVDDEWLELIKDDVTAFLNKYGYQNTPVIPVSATTGKGIDELRQIIDINIERQKRKISDKPFRLYVDRSFSAKGYGSIVTGTILSSSIKTGDKLHVQPSGLETKVRGLQVHQHDAERGYSGQRVAINLAGLDVDQLYRGAVLTEPDAMDTTNELLAEVHPVEDITFKVRRHMNVRVHIGTDEIPGKMNWYEDGAFSDTAKRYHIRIKLARPACAAPGDAILIRSQSPVTTLAGGRILEINPPRLNRHDDSWHSHMLDLKSDDISSRTEALFRHLGYQTLTANQIRKKLFLNREQTEEVLSLLTKKRRLSDFEYKNDVHYVSVNVLEQVIAMLPEIIENELATESYKKSLNFGELKNLLLKKGFSEAFLTRCLTYAVNKSVIFFDGERYTTETLRQSNAHANLKADLETHFLEHGYSVSSIDELAKRFSSEQQIIKNLTAEMAKAGTLQSIKGQFYYHKKHYDELVLFLKKFFKTNTSLGISDVKNFTQSTRKFIVPLMEFFDNRGYTVREGDIRKKGPNLPE